MLWVWLAFGLTASTILGAKLIQRSRELGYTVLAVLFACYVLSANVLVPRLASIPLLFATATIPSGSLLWPFTGQLSDMINEIYGKYRAYIAVALAFGSNLLFVLFVRLVGSASAAGSPATERYWQSYFAFAPRILLASTIAFFAAESIDITIFSRLKDYAIRSDEDRSVGSLIGFAALRGSVSDLGNMLVDSAVFASVAFIGVLPAGEFWSVVVSSVVVKCLLGVLETPWFILFRFLTKSVPRVPSSQLRRPWQPESVS